MHYKNAEGQWLTIDPRLKRLSDKVFIAQQQPFPVEINLEKGFTSLITDQKIFFNQNIRMFEMGAREIINEQIPDENAFLLLVTMELSNEIFSGSLSPVNS